MKELRLYCENLLEDGMNLHKLQHMSVAEQRRKWAGVKNWLYFGVDEAMQLTPNCMPNTESVIFGNFGFMVTRATCIKNYEKCKKEFKITLTKDRSKKYFYVVEPQGMYTQVIESLPKLINKDVLEDMKNDKAILCISYIQEGDYHQDFYKDINKFCEDTSISINNIVFLTNNPKIEKTENIFNVNYYLNHMTVTYQNNPNRYNSIKNLNFENIRPYYFLSFNRNAKLHRKVLGSLLLKNNLLDKGMMSMGYNIDGIAKFDTYMPTQYNRRTPIYSEEKIKELDLHRYMSELKNMCPLLIDGDITNLLTQETGGGFSANSYYSIEIFIFIDSIDFLFLLHRLQPSPYFV